VDLKEASCGGGTAADWGTGTAAIETDDCRGVGEKPSSLFFSPDGKDETQTKREDGRWKNSQIGELYPWRRSSEESQHRRLKHREPAQCGPCHQRCWAR